MPTIKSKLLSSKVFKNFSYLALGNLISQALGLLSIIKITQKISPNDYGVFTFLMTQGALLVAIGDLGAKGVIIRSIARDKSRTNDLVVNGFKLRVITILGLTLLYLVYNYFLGSLSLYQISLISLFSLVSCMSTVFEAVFIGNQKMLLPSLIGICISLIWCAIVFFLPFKLVDATLFFLMYSILNILKGGVLYYYVRSQKLLVGKIEQFFLSSRSLFKEVWPFFLQMVVVLPINYLSNNFLDVNSTPVEVGYFNLSQKLTSPVLLVLGFGLSAIFPNLASLYTKDSRKFSDLVEKSFKHFFLFAVVLCFLFTLFAKEIVTILFDDNYMPAVEVCQLQIWYVFMMGINSLIGTIWAATNHEKLILKTAIINALISTPLLYYGSLFGALGLAYGYVISFAIFGVYLFYTFIKVQKIDIKEDLPIWLLSVGLFVLSFFILQDKAIVYRLVPAFIVSALAILYIRSNRFSF